LSLHQQQSYPGLIPVTPHIHPANSSDTKGQFSVANPPNLPLNWGDEQCQADQCWSVRLMNENLTKAVLLKNCEFKWIEGRFQGLCLQFMIKDCMVSLEL